MRRKRNKIVMTIKEDISNNLKSYFIIVVIFIIGIFLGVMYINQMKNKSQIEKYIHTYVDETKTIQEGDYFSEIQKEIKKNTQSPKNRPPYIYQIPLTFIPGIGGKTIEKLLETFETEMNILHKMSQDDIEAVVGEKVAKNIVNAREGKAKVESGGGGNYGKVTAS